MQKLLCSLTTLILLSCNSQSQKQADLKSEKNNFETTEAWTTRLVSDYFDLRNQADVRIKRLGETQGMVTILNSLEASLDSARNKRIGQERIFFPMSYRPIWKNDKADTSAWFSRVSRIKYVSDSIVKIWTPALEAQHGSQVSEIWVIGFLIDTKSMFTNNTLNVHRSNQLLSRVTLLPKPVTDSLAKALNITKAWAAMLLIQNDDLFEANGNIRQSQLDAAMKLLNEKISKK